MKITHTKEAWGFKNSDAIIMFNAGTPTDGTTGAAQAGKGSVCIDTTNGKLYVNGGTKASPTWKLVTSAS